MSGSGTDPFAALPTPKFDADLVVAFSRNALRKVLVEERSRRHLLRAHRKAASHPRPPSPLEEIGAAIQCELDRLTEENATEVRARLKELHASREALTVLRPWNFDEQLRAGEALFQVEDRAWEQLLARDEPLVRQWEAAFASLSTSPRSGFTEFEAALDRKFHNRMVAALMLGRAAAGVPAARSMLDRVARVLPREDTRS